MPLNDLLPIVTHHHSQQVCSHGINSVNISNLARILQIFWRDSTFGRKLICAHQKLAKFEWANRLWERNESLELPFEA